MPKAPAECPIPNSQGCLGLTGQGDLLFVGEASGHYEAFKGKQFVGPAGTMLKKLLSAAGLDDVPAAYVNCLRCHPPGDWLVNAPWEQRALDCCKPHLQKALDEGKWKVVVTLGATATKEVLSLPRNRGKEGIKLDNFHGAPVWDKQREFWVVPTYHPSYLLKGAQKLFKTVVWDLKKAASLLRGEWKYDEPKLIGDPDPEWFDQWVGQVTESDWYWLAVDTETPDKGKTAEDQLKGRDASWEILFYNFAVSDEEGVSVPNLPQYKKGIDRLLGDERSWKLIWHRNFDLPRMELERRQVRGEIHEAMDLWHTAQPHLPRSLGFAAPHFCNNWPWKHLPNTDPQYRCLDAVWLWKIAAGCVEMISEAGLKDVYRRHHYLVDKWALLPATRIGLPFNKERLQQWTDGLTAEEETLQGEIQRMVPEKTLGLAPKGGLVKKPDEEGLVEKVEKKLVKECSTCGDYPVTKTHRCKDEKGKISKELQPKVEFAEKEVQRWYRRVPFNPGSATQVLARIKAVGHKPGKQRKTKKDTTDKKTLKRLIKTGDPFYQKCLEYRDISKMRGTYGNGILEKIDDSGRVHGFYTNKPWTFRKASADPNLQNLPSHARLAKGFKDCVEAAPGCELALIDFAGIEAVLTGWCIWDPDYIRLAKLGMHAFLCSHYVHRYLDSSQKPADKNWPDDELGSFLKEIKKRFDGEPSDPYPRSKRVVHGCVTGDHEVLTPRGWVRFDALEDSEEIMTWSPKNEELRWDVPIHVTREQHDGEVIEFLGRGLSAITTPEHRFGVRYSSIGPWRIETAENVQHATNWRIPVCGTLKGTQPWTAQHALAVAVQADGSLGYQNTWGWRFHVVRPRKIERLRNLLQESGIEWKERECGCHAGGIHLTFHAELPLLREKHFDLQAVLQLTPEAREEFLSEVLLWDGHTGNSSKRYEYMSTCKEDVEVVQTVAHVTGRQGTLRRREKSRNSYGKKPLWVVGLNRRKASRTGCLDKKERRPYSGMIYCVSVPTEHFLVRHRDRVWVSANSNYGLTEWGMVEQFPESFPNLKAAREIKHLYEELCPALPAWHRKIWEIADRNNGFGGPPGRGNPLPHPFDFPFHFFQVKQWKKSKSGDWEWKPGPDAKKAASAFPQSIASGILDETMLYLTQPGEWDDVWIGDAYYGETPLRLQIHDALMLEYPAEKREEVLGKAVKCMTRPIKQLRLDPEWGMGDHLTIDVEVQVGKTWGSLEVLKESLAADVYREDDEEEEDEEDVA